MKKLQDIFRTDARGRTTDEKGYLFGWDFKSSTQSSSNIVYVIGCSWLLQSDFNKVFSTKKDTLLINRSWGDQGNSSIIDTLERDIPLVDDSATFIVCFSEVGRNKQDFVYQSPVGYTSTHDYFRDILIKQYQKVAEILQGKKSFITTSFVPNPFNDNKRLIDFCGTPVDKSDFFNFDAVLEKQADSFVITTDIFQYLKNYKLFKFNFDEDLSKTLNYIEWLESHHYVGEKLYPSGIKPFENFIDYIMDRVYN